jgi:phosphomannomutase
LSGGHRFDPTILREYDIRGVVGENLGIADARALGRVFARLVRESGGRAVVTAYDGRESSPSLEAALVEALTEGGIDVRRIGLGPTPMLYYAAKEMAAGGAVMVTGSHNPPAHNGFKLVLGEVSLYGDAIQRLGRMALDVEKVAPTPGSTSRRSVVDDYVRRLAAGYRGSGRTLAVAWDAGNGATGDVMTQLTRLLPGRHVLLNAEIDGRFPGHHPDPTVPENLRQLQETVLAEGCDLGVAFDGDGDRIGVVDGRARIVWGDQLLVLLARDVLARRPGATIIADVKASRVLFDEVRKAGGNPVMWRAGHSLIKAKMAELKAPLAGELSGHVFIADDYYGFDDGLYAAVRLLDILSRSPVSLADMHAALPVMATMPEVRFDCPEERKFAVIEEVKSRLRASGATFIDIDGVRVETEDGWWLLRASNTQASLVIRCEAADIPGLDRLRRALVSELVRSGVEPPEALQSEAILL